MGILLAVVFWGISFVATKRALLEIPPAALIVTRFSMGFVLLAAILGVRRGYRRVPAKDLAEIALLGFLGVAFHQWLQSTALVTARATATSWLISLTPIFAAILALAILRERFPWWKTAGIALGALGALLVVTRGDLSGASLSLPESKGEGLILVSCVNWALVSVLSKGVLRRQPPLVVTTYGMAAGLLFLLAFALATGAFRTLASLTPGGWGAVVFLGVFCSGLAYLFWYDALAGMEASAVVAFLYIEPFVTVLAAWIWIGERVSPITLAGGMVILAGVALVNRRTAGVPAGEIRVVADEVAS
jgi:drug/metabolite transporter (DMT)-like permease